MATRRERVVLDLEDNLTPGLARAAVAATALDKSLDNLGGTSKDVRREMDPLGSTSGPVARAAVQSERGAREIDRLSGRIRVLADVAAILGPGLIPVAAVGIPAIAGLAEGFGAAALAGGTAIIAFQGVGDALEAVNQAALEPTEANLEKARLAMEQISPVARDLVTQLHEMQPVFDRMRDSAAAGLFPGLQEGLTALKPAADEVEDILFRIGDALGDLLGEGGASLAGERWAPFLDFLSTEVPSALTAMGRAVGDVAHGLAELWMAFAPLNRDFSDWMLRAAEGFDRWATGLSQTNGFQEFVDYIRANGPKVGEAVASIANAILQIVEAASPLGGPVLDALTAVSKAIAAIADSNAGPAIMATVTALALLNRSMSVYERVSERAWVKSVKAADGLGNKLTAARGPLLRGTAALAGLGVASTGVADGLGLSNTVALGLTGTLAGPWGAAVGGAIGLMLDLSASSGQFKVNADDLQATLDQQTGAITANTSAWAANELEKGGVLSAAQSLDLSLADVTEAALGNTDALARVNAGLDAAKEGFYDTDGRVQVSAKTLDDYRNNMFLVRNAIGETSGELDHAQGRIQRIGEATHDAGGKFRGASVDINAFTRSLQHLNDVLDQRANIRDYEAALDDFRKAVKENGKTLDENTPKGRAVQEALDNIARTAVQAADKLEGIDKINFLANARRDFIDAAAKIVGTREKAAGLASELGLLTRKEWIVRLSAETGAAISKIGGLKSELASIDRNIDIYTRLHIQRIPTASGMGPQVGSADGGTVHGPRYPYGDKMLYLLAPGEEVISNRSGQADRHRQLLKAINANKMADGGTAGRFSASSPQWIDPMAGLHSGLYNVATALHFLRRRLDESSAALDAEKARRDELRAKAAEVSSGIASGLSGDIWAGAADPWAAGAKRYDPVAALNARRDRARRLIAAINTLRGKGITGDALASILNEGLEAAEYMAASADLTAYTTAFAESERAVAQAAALGGQATYGAAADAMGPGISELNKTVKRLEKTIERLSGEHKHEGRKNADKVAGKGDFAAANARKRAKR